MKKNLSWGVLFHIQGQQELSTERLERAMNNQQAPEELKNLSIKLIEYIKCESTERLKCPMILQNLIEILGKILSPKKEENVPKLSNECPRSHILRKADDSPGKGYSRDPFKEINEDLAADIAFAAVIYLLRGYAIFFCRPRNIRDFNAAKVALNDFFQCGQLAWRLYRSLDSCHSLKGSQDEYLKKVKMGCDPLNLPDPEKSSYFVWSILLMLEIQRGNVYKQIDYLDEASRFYRHCQQRLERFQKVAGDNLLLDEKNTFGDDWLKFSTPTVVKAFSEMSKVQFDLGYFLESLKNQTLCLAYLVKMGKAGWPPQKESTGNLLIDHLSKIIKFLDSENRQMIFDTELIAGYYGYSDNPKEESIQPSRFKDLLPPGELLEFAVDVLARVGFTLSTLRRINLPIPDNEWPGEFFNAHRIVRTRWEVNPSPLGQYCTRAGIQALSVSLDSLEKKFTHWLRQDLNQLDKDQQFYKEILDATTNNILNIATIPRRNQRLLMRRGYRWRRKEGDLSQDTVWDGVRVTLYPQPTSGGKESKLQNKLVVLRRWQSINPKIPRPGEHKLRGGGYFLLWQGKGIVIDPGYNFIQNFYDEGFSLADIDAVVITHSHPDHDDDFSTLITLIREWNEYHALTGQCDEKYGIKKLDFFLNESTNLKFSAWLKSSEVRIGRVVSLPSVWWDKDSKKPTDGKIRGEPVTIGLCNDKNPEESYSLKMEVMPAWHDDVIGKTEAVGIKFHLYESKPKDSSSGYIFEEVGIVGYTGDTGAYGHDLTGQNPDIDKKIEDLYMDCDVLVAHLGDIRIRELMTLILKDDIDNHPIQKLFEDWFGKDVSKDKVTPQRVREFVRFLIALDLVPAKALLAELELSGSKSRPICEWLEMLTKPPDFEGEPTIGPTTERLVRELNNRIEKTFDELGFHSAYKPIRQKITLKIHYRRDQAIENLFPETRVSDGRLSWVLVGFLCGFSMVPWQYPYHLGIFGLYQLFKKMLDYCKRPGQEKEGRIFIVGELPEELSSYRHHVARRLNSIEGNRIDSTTTGIERKRVHAFTGDIGFHLSISPYEGKIVPKVRCAYCNYNNETVLKKGNNHYHEPSKIREVPIKRLNSAMIYLCTEFDHYPEAGSFLSRPNLRVI